MKFFCIADDDTVRGFGLAGVAGRAVHTRAEAAQALAQALIQPDLAIVVITQAVAARIRDQVDTARLERDRPLLVEIPGPEGPLSTRKSLRQLVHSAVGISLDEKPGA